MDGSFRRAGSIPFKWEIQPGVPKPYPSSPSPSPSQKLLNTPKLSPPPPSKKNNSCSRSPLFFSSPFLPPPPPSHRREPSPAFFRRSSSSSPSKRLPSKAAHATANPPRQVLVDPVSQGCFAIPSLRREEEKKKKSFLGGGGGGRSISNIVFRSPRRSVSARSLPSRYASQSYAFAASTPPSRKKDGRERDDQVAKVATRWMF